jgi:hypothetical protein
MALGAGASTDSAASEEDESCEHERAPSLEAGTGRQMTSRAYARGRRVR